MERFLSVSDSKILRESFAGLWAGNDITAVEQAKLDPANYVLKPQREGGGNNMYGQELKEKLENASSEELSSYILMQRLFPQLQPAILIGRGKR